MRIRSLLDSSPPPHLSRTGRWFSSALHPHHKLLFLSFFSQWSCACTLNTWSGGSECLLMCRLPVRSGLFSGTFACYVWCPSLNRTTSLNLYRFCCLLLSLHCRTALSSIEILLMSCRSFVIFGRSCKVLSASGMASAWSSGGSTYLLYH